MTKLPDPVPSDEILLEAIQPLSKTAWLGNDRKSDVGYKGDKSVHDYSTGD